MDNYQTTGQNSKTRLFISFVLMGMIFWLGACNKSLDYRLPAASNSMRDSTGNIRTLLHGSSFTLFNQAFLRAGLDSVFGVYTVFAPSDSAMTAAGLTSTAINALPLDSLQQLIGYHLLLGSYGDTSILDNDTLTARLPSLTRDVYHSLDPNNSSTITEEIYQQDLFIWRKGVLYINGLPADGGAPPLRAINGYIYKIDHVLLPPSRDLWSIILSRPELSMYVAAIRLVDSFSVASNFSPLVVYDSAVFSQVLYNIPNYPSYLPPPAPNTSTVFAPTNNAFAKAGFNTVDDIRQYVVQSVPGFYDQPTPPYAHIVNYNAMDSVLKSHYLYTQNQNSMVFYQDMLYSPLINNGTVNAHIWSASNTNQPGVVLAPPYLQFSNHNGTVYLQWNQNGAVAPAPLSLSSAATFLATNGVIYETDQLFYPHN